MSYLYHRVPKNLTGNILYPLNVLKEKYPDIYQEHVKKYVGREHLLQEKIPPLHCLWNDVLHFSPVNPAEIKKALIKAGAKSDAVRLFYQIDSTIFDPKNTVTYLYPPTNKINQVNKKTFIPYNPDDLEKFSNLPKATKEYYKQMIMKGEQPLLYHYVTHILHKGELDTTNLPIISV